MNHRAPMFVQFDSPTYTLPQLTFCLEILSLWRVCACVCLSVRNVCVCVCVVLTSSQSGRKSIREHGEKMVLAQIKEYCCQRKVQTCPVFLTSYIDATGPSNPYPAPLLCLAVYVILLTILARVFVHHKICFSTIHVSHPVRGHKISKLPEM